MPLYLVRHAPVALNGTCYGQINVATAVTAENAVNSVKTQLLSEPMPDTVWSSPLLRCLELANAYSDAVCCDPRLMEANFGLWEGMRWDDIHEQYPLEMAQWGENWIDVPPPEGESAAMVQARLESFAFSLEAGIHLGFSHAGVIRAARVSLGGCSWADAMSRPVPYLSFERFQIPVDKAA